MELFFKWLKDRNTIISKSQENEFLENEKIWNVAENTIKINLPDKKVEWDKMEALLTNTENKTRNIGVFFVLKIAASVALLIVAGFVFYTISQRNSIYKTGKTMENVVLIDGSEIILNKNSTLEVSKGFNKKNRNILLSGEAFFKVKKGKFPFIVTSGFAQVKVLGTHFNVKSNVNKVELAVKEGLVSFVNLCNTSKGVNVSVGQYSVCTKNLPPTTPQKIAYNEYPGWINNMLVFQENTLEEICNELEIYFEINIEIEEDSLKNKTVSGVLESKTPQEALTILCSLIQHKHKFEKGKYVIY